MWYTLFLPSRDPRLCVIPVGTTDVFLFRFTALTFLFAYVIELPLLGFFG